MPLPRSVNELQRFLGVVNYFFNYFFMSDLTEHTAPLRNVLKKDTVFELQGPQLNVIEKLKTWITLAPCLKIFDSNFPARLRTDTSSVGVGAFLEQNYGTVDKEKLIPVSYSLRALWDYEKRYAQIEKETLHKKWSFPLRISLVNVKVKTFGVSMVLWVFVRPKIDCNRWR